MSPIKTEDKEPPSLGQVAYDTYCEFRGWMSVGGEELPEWDDQSEDLRESWEAAAAAVLAEARDRVTGSGGSAFTKEK
jgi:hypothetical protein